MLKRRHCACVDVEIGIDLDHVDLPAATLEEDSYAARCDALADFGGEVWSAWGFSHVKGGDAILTPRGRASAHDDVLHALVDGASDAHALHGASSLAAVAPADQKHKDDNQ